MDQLYGHPAFPDFNDEIAAAVLEEAGRFANEVIAPLNQAGDRETARLERWKQLTSNSSRDIDHSNGDRHGPRRGREFSPHVTCGRWCTDPAAPSRGDSFHEFG